MQKKSSGTMARRYLTALFTLMTALFTELGKAMQRFSSALFPMFGVYGDFSEHVAKAVATVLFDITLSDKAEVDFAARAKLASGHLEQAGKILDGLQDALAKRKTELDGVVADVERRQAEADHWEKIASINKDEGSALTREIEQRIRQELERGKWTRRIVATVLWVVTLLAGAVVGALVQNRWRQWFGA